MGEIEGSISHTKTHKKPRGKRIRVVKINSNGISIWFSAFTSTGDLTHTLLVAKENDVIGRGENKFDQTGVKIPM